MKKISESNDSSNEWVTGSIGDFLGLSDADVRLIDLKIALKGAVKQCRTESNLTQTQLAELIESSQSRIAKIEGGDPSVSIDLMVRALFAMDVSLGDLAIAISPEAQDQLSDIEDEYRKLNITAAQTIKRLDSLEYSMYQLQSALPTATVTTVFSSNEYSNALPFWSAPKPTVWLEH